MFENILDHMGGLAKIQDSKVIVDAIQMFSALFHILGPTGI